MEAWLHTHLPRLRAGDTPDVISVKVPGQRIEYAAIATLTEARFVVHERGRLRCVREGVRNVHAWVVGELTDTVAGHRPYLDFPPMGWRTAVYDPWKGGAFVDAETLEPVHRAGHVIFQGKNVWFTD